MPVGSIIIQITTALMGKQTLSQSSEDWTCRLTWEQRERARRIVSPAFGFEMVPFSFDALKNNVKPRFCQLIPLLFMLWHFHSICTYYSMFSVWFFLFVVNCSCKKLTNHFKTSATFNVKLSVFTCLYYPPPINGTLRFLFFLFYKNWLVLYWSP